jgi:hypothetical protein
VEQLHLSFAAQLVLLSVSLPHFLLQVRKLPFQIRHIFTQFQTSHRDHLLPANNSTLLRRLGPSHFFDSRRSIALDLGLGLLQWRFLLIVQLHGAIEGRM